MESTISFPAVALFFTAIGMTLTLVTSIAVVVWRFSALSQKMESLTAKMEEIVSDLRTGRNQAESLGTRMALVELRIESLNSILHDIANRLAKHEETR